MQKETDSAFFEQLLGNSRALDPRKLYEVFLSRWWWIVISLAVAGLLCFLYLKYVTPQYLGSVTLKYLEKQSQLDELSSGQPTFIFSSGSRDYLTEKFNVRSPDVVRSTLVRMNRPFTFYRVKDLRKINVYPALPLDLEVIHYDASRYQGGTFELDEELVLSYQAGETAPVSRNITAGTVVHVPGLSFRIKNVATAADNEFLFTHNDPDRLISYYVERIDMEEAEDAMPVMTLTFRHHNGEYTNDFLANLVEAYQEYDLRQKQKSSDLTIRFIKDQGAIYAGYLKQAARQLELFKQKNKLVDVSASAIELMNKVRDLEQRKNELEIQKAYVDMLRRNMGRTFDTIDYLSVGLDGSTDAVLVDLLTGFNDLITQRKQLLLKYSASSPPVRALDEQLAKFRRQILDNIELQSQKNSGTARILEENLTALKGQFSRIPELEKNYLYLQSDFEVNQNIYSLLLNKEIESSIVKAGMLPSFSVITQFDTDKVSPITWRVVLMFLLVGLTAGFGSVILARLLNGTFTETDKIGQQPGVTLLGSVQHFGHKVTNTPQDLAHFINDRSAFVESLSALRTRLSFAKSSLDTSGEPDKENEGKLILVTSERAGEGKSFVTINLALSFSRIGKRIVVIGADLRKSRIHLFFNVGRQYGLSDYLQDPESPMEKVIYASSIPNLDYIPAGSPPFNPGELLQQPAMEQLLTYCRQSYDYILLDTAPVGLVADNVPLLRQSDHILFIIRWLFSNPEAYLLAGQLVEEYELKEVKVIVNDFYPDQLYGSMTAGASYGSGYSSYRYGYAYQDNDYLGESPQGWKNKVRVWRKKAKKGSSPPTI